MFRNIALFVLMLVPTMTYAQLESQFVFNGQNAETLTAEKKVSIRVSEQVQVPSTCSRRIPQQEYVCRDVTRYRQSCHTVPSSQECSSVPHRDCRTVYRTRQECSGSSSQTVCTDTPSRQVCTDRPTREVCTTRPDGRQHCTTVGGGQHCTTVGGGRSCREVPGNRVCRDVSYPDQECSTTYRQECRTIPSRQECSQIPYSENVCGNETTYRTETYACTETQTVYSSIPKTVKSETNVQILTNGIVEEFPVQVTLTEKSPEFSSFTIATKLLKQPKAFVVLKKQESKVVSTTKTEIVLKNTVVLEVLSQEMLPISFPTSIASASIEAATSKLNIVFEGPIASIGKADLLITHKAFLRSKKTIAEFKGEYPSEKVELGMVGEKAALMIDLKDSIKSELQSRNMLLKFTLEAGMNLQGEIMNETKPVTSKLYEGTFVQLK